jgi:hypothetical protein
MKEQSSETNNGSMTLRNARDTGPAKRKMKGSHTAYDPRDRGASPKGNPAGKCGLRG